MSLSSVNLAFEWGWESEVRSQQDAGFEAGRAPQWFRPFVTCEPRLSRWNFLVTQVIKWQIKWYSDFQNNNNASSCIRNIIQSVSWLGIHLSKISCTWPQSSPSLSHLVGLKPTTTLGFISDLMVGGAGILFQDTAGVFYLPCGSSHSPLSRCWSKTHLSYRKRAFNLPGHHFPDGSEHAARTGPRAQLWPLVSQAGLKGEKPFRTSCFGVWLLWLGALISGARFSICLSRRWTPLRCLVLIHLGLGYLRFCSFPSLLWLLWVFCGSTHWSSVCHPAGLPLPFSSYVAPFQSRLLQYPPGMQLVVSDENFKEL